jgi:hypothetical protein
MKLSAIILIAGTCLVSLATSKEQQDFPDFLKLSKKHILYNWEKNSSNESYLFTTDSSFTELKKEISEQLGSEWIAELRKTEENESKEKFVVFRHPKRPDVQIWFRHQKVDFMGKEFSVSLDVLKDLPIIEFVEQDGVRQ